MTRTFQTTFDLVAFATEAVNCCIPAGATETEAGEMLRAAVGAVMVTVASAEALELCAETAVTLTVAAWEPPREPLREPYTAPLFGGPRIALDRPVIINGANPKG